MRPDLEGFLVYIENKKTFKSCRLKVFANFGGSSSDPAGTRNHLFGPFDK